MGRGAEPHSAHAGCTLGIPVTQKRPFSCFCIHPGPGPPGPTSGPLPPSLGDPHSTFGQAPALWRGPAPLTQADRPGRPLWQGLPATWDKFHLKDISLGPNVSFTKTSQWEGAESREGPLVSVAMDEPGPFGCLGPLRGSHLGVNPQEGGEEGRGGGEGRRTERGGPTPAGSRWQPA